MKNELEKCEQLNLVLVYFCLRFGIELQPALTIFAVIPNQFFPHPLYQCHLIINPKHRVLIVNVSRRINGLICDECVIVHSIHSPLSLPHPISPQLVFDLIPLSCWTHCWPVILYILLLYNSYAIINLLFPITTWLFQVISNISILPKFFSRFF